MTEPFGRIKTPKIWRIRTTTRGYGVKVKKLTEEQVWAFVLLCSVLICSVLRVTWNSLGQDGTTICVEAGAKRSSLNNRYLNNKITQKVQVIIL